jgi:hypothetical protein
MEGRAQSLAAWDRKSPEQFEARVIRKTNL